MKASLGYTGKWNIGEEKRELNTQPSSEPLNLEARADIPIWDIITLPWINILVDFLSGVATHREIVSESG